MLWLEKTRQGWCVEESVAYHEGWRMERSRMEKYMICGLWTGEGWFIGKEYKVVLHVLLDKESARK
jgi:hypothetical protein